jgi:hypothetical protein
MLVYNSTGVNDLLAGHLFSFWRGQLGSSVMNDREYMMSSVQQGPRLRGMEMEKCKEGDESKSTMLILLGQKLFEQYYRRVFI